MASLCSSFSNLRVAPKALTSRRCGINAAPRLSAAAPAPRVAPVCTAIEAKYKLKTRSAVAKRFKVTSSGKVIRRHAGKQHLNEKKRPKQLKRLSKEESVFVGDVRVNIRKAMPYAKISLKNQREANKQNK